MELQTLQDRAKRAYEWARWRRAVLGALPVLALVGLALTFTGRPEVTFVVGALVFLGAAVLLWFGHGLPRAAWMGLATGALPLVLSLCSTRIGHACVGKWCMEVCLTTSVMGGAATGLLIGSWAFNRNVPRPMLMTATAFGVATGAMGTTCVGAAGFAALLVGVLVGVGTQWVRLEARA